MVPEPATLGRVGMLSIGRTELRYIFRATSTQNGRILKTVYTSRTVLSQKVDVGLFRFVSFQRLLEAETGFTHNEPAELAVREAIEKAVHSLVIEGVLEGLWRLKDPEDVNSPAITLYQQEEEAKEHTDYLGRRFDQFRRSQLRLSVNGGTFRYAGDYANPLFRPFGEIAIGSQVTPWLSAGIVAGQGVLAGEGTFQETVTYAGVSTYWRLFPTTRFTPILRIGGGMISERDESLLSGYPQMNMGVGGEFLVNERIGIQGGLAHHYVFSDELDNMVQGKYNDFFWSGSLGINIYFGRK